MAAIDIGSPAIDGNSTAQAKYARVEMANPANTSGKITSIEIWAYSDMTAVEVAMFYRLDPVTFPNKLTTRSNVTLGNIAAGEHSILNGNPITVDSVGNPISLNVVEGDFIGINATGGNIEGTSSGAGHWYSAVAGDRIPCTNYTFAIQTNYTLSLYGTGATESTILEFFETLSVTDTMATSWTLAKAETLSIVDTWSALIAFFETLSIIDSKVTSGELDLNETLSIMDTKVTSTSLFFQETLSIIDSVIKSITKQFSESLSITDSKLLIGSLELDETLGIVDSAVYQCIKTFYETLSIIDTKITSGSLEFNETLSIVDSWTVLKNFFETLSITDTISKTGSLNVSEIISIIDSFIRWIEHPIYTEPAKSSLSFTKPTKTNPVYTKPVKGTTSFTEPAKSNPVYTEPTKGHPVYIEPTKEIKLD